MNNKGSGILNSFKIFFETVKNMFSYNKKVFISYYTIFIISGIGFGINLYLKQSIFDNLDKSIINTFYLLVVLLITSLIITILNGYSNYMAEKLDMNVSTHFQEKLIFKIQKIENINFEDSNFLDLLDRAKEGLHSAIYYTNSIMDLIFMYMPIIISTGIYLFFENKLLPIILLVIFIPTLLTVKIKKSRYNDLEEEIGHLGRKRSLYISYFTKPSSFKELIVNNRFEYFISMINDTIKLIHDKKEKVEIKNLYLDLLSNLLSLGSYIGILIGLLYFVLNNKIKISTFIVIFYTLDELYSLMEGAILNSINTQLMNLSKAESLYKILNYTEKKETEDSQFKELIEVNNLSFKYPNSDYYALRDISIKINKNDIIAIVGTNGSGKTTLGKLLVGLYQPTKGRVLYDGKDICQINKDKHSGVFQNFMKYPLSISENIYIGDVNKEFNEARIEEILGKRGFSLKKFNKDTLLGKELGGTELSGGEWQKLALGRSDFRNGEVILLDEPTASIDPLEEDKILSSYKEYSKGKTTFIITHRLSSVLFTDKVLVLKEGQIECFGSHKELLKSSDYYNELWNSQVERYL